MQVESNLVHLLWYNLLTFYFSDEDFIYKKHIMMLNCPTVAPP